MANHLLPTGLIYLVGVNLAAFVLYGMDKRRARQNQWRIPERVLLGIAFLGGCVGAAAGMATFHHKTRKAKFRVGVLAAWILWAALLMLSGVHMAPWFR